MSSSEPPPATEAGDTTSKPAGQAGSGEPFEANRWLQFLETYRGLIAFILVFLLGCYYSPRAVDTGLPIFLSWQTQLDILYEYAEYGLLATGMTLVILTGGIDLSVGSVLGLSATLFALLTIGYGWGALPAAAAVLLAGLAAGSVSGALIARFGMQPFVATLAMMTAARGVAKMMSGNIKVQPAAQPWYKLTQDTPAFFQWMTTSLPGIGLRPASILFLVSILVMAVIVRKSTYGRRLYAIGGNEEAAHLSGLKVGRTKLITYALCAGFAALAGIVNASRQDLGNPEAGATFELDAIAAVVIGGTSLAGGRGGMMFTLLGVLIIAYINKILSLNNTPAEQRMIIQAVIIAVAVLIQRQKRGVA
jgi:ribose transport system permease protein